MSATTTSSKPSRHALRPSVLVERSGLVIAWIVAIAVFGILKPDTFLTSANFSTIFGSQAVLVVLALALVVPLTAGDYDLSIAGVLALSSMLVAYLNAEHGVPLAFAILAALGAGALVGAINGALAAVFEIDPFIVTLGTGTILEGLVLWLSDSQTISGISTTLSDAVITTRFLGVALGFWYGIALCVVLWIVFEYTPLGRRLLFVGRGRRVAALSGFNLRRLRWGALIASGTIAAFAGVLYAGVTGGADPSSGATFLLPAYAAAFLGATAIVPGRFNPWGTVIAVYFLVTGITGLTILGAAAWVQDVFYGTALVLAVALSTWSRRRSGAAAADG
ncbi:ABC transporter permease [Conexibacter sp. CPCC 206217]|uniref:ABC transporter permease n=1 Tax=Conexibacter sp. CPCC 206217 TaxID=3064574 RepID=UPI00272763F0|nr:ABC transporter permease [Conexibacter sp. CPCC 206217]MDO8213289.1 ABC transporter permease [Conexibacter sp. CPCC 206217]